MRTLFSAPRVPYTRNGQPATICGLNGSASLAGDRLLLTVTNPSLREARDAEIALRGGRVKSAEAVTLTATDVRRGNTFDDPRAIEPKRQTLAVGGSGFVHLFPPTSVTSLELVLG